MDNLQQLLQMLLGKPSPPMELLKPVQIQQKNNQQYMNNFGKDPLLVKPPGPQQAQQPPPPPRSDMTMGILPKNLIMPVGGEPEIYSPDAGSGAGEVDTSLLNQVQEATRPQIPPGPAAPYYPAHQPPAQIPVPQQTEILPPEITSIAPSQEMAAKPTINDFLKAFAGIQVPEAPEGPRISSPPPPARPQTETGGLLKLLLAMGAGGGAGAAPLSQFIGRN